MKKIDFKTVSTIVRKAQKGLRTTGGRRWSEGHLKIIAKENPVIAIFLNEFHFSGTRFHRMSGIESAVMLYEMFRVSSRKASSTKKKPEPEIVYGPAGRDRIRRRPQL